MTRALFALALVSFALVAPARAQEKNDFDRFLERPEKAYRWEKKGEEVVNGVKVHDLFLVSQEWQGAPWEHRLMVFVPERVEHPGFCSLFNTGGRGGKKDQELGALIARESGAVFAILFGIPNQPLYGKTEDALIAHTWVKFMETGDPSWPLHFPMAKSVIKSMDTIQSWAPQAGLGKIERFSISGASKRGWTTWLVGASKDPRVTAIAPMVIDILNVAKQGPHMLASYGKPSEQIADYTAANMGELLKTERGKLLLDLCDPWSYRKRLTMPKLIVLGTNDRYWTQDALNLYWDDLTGPKWVIYVPNSGHGLEDRSRVMATMIAFTRMAAGGAAWPKMDWEWKDNVIGLDSDQVPVEVRVFTADSKTLDFRDSRWSFRRLTLEGLGTTAIGYPVPLPTEGHRAAFLEAVFAVDGKRFTLSTQLKILSAPTATSATPSTRPAERPAKKFY